ncbi:hypothetical protein LJC26_02630 [Desulfovibrio sp. OttesenSCG-928-O18]|nr:hypothetical protein [Desulfovibrio sp. OttesenSCG-928-O18]
MGMDATPEQSATSKKAMAALFKAAAGDAAKRFRLVYAFNTDVSSTSFIIRTTTYTYVSYILGYDEAAQEIVLLETDPELENYGELLSFPRENVRKARYGSFTAQYTLRDARLRKGYIQFCVPHITDDPELYPPVLQEEEAEAFNTFFLAHFADPEQKGFMGKLTRLFGAQA